MNNNNFLETYQSLIMPKIRELDLIMKDNNYYIDIDCLSDAVSANVDEIEEILEQINEPCPTKENIFDIIALCKSQICKMIMREHDCGSPKSYTAFQIAYIYGLSSKGVQEAFDSLNINKAKPSDLYGVFANVREDEF